MRNLKLEALVTTSEQLLVLVCSVICARIGIQSGYTIGVIAGVVLAIVFTIELFVMASILVVGLYKHNADKELKEYDDFCNDVTEEQVEMAKDVFSKK